MIMKQFIIYSACFLGTLFLNSFSSNSCNYLLKAKENSIQFDTSLNDEIFLINEKSILRSVGDVYPYLNKEDESVLLFSKKGDEYLKMHHELGGGRNSYDRFEVGYTKKENEKKELLTKYDHFITESGISLGIDKDAFLKKTCKKKLKISYENDFTVYQYSNTEWLYNAQYYFRSNTLVKFCFGYETP